MKFVKRLTILLLLATIFSCGSSEKVIRDGKVYTIKGNEILSNGVNVSENLTSEEKNAIKSVLEERLAAKKANEEEQEALEAKQEELEKIQEKAEAEQELLEAQQQALEDKIEAKEDAREAFLKADAKLKNKQQKYKELRDEGKLSPKDDEKWAEKLKELQEERDKKEQLFNAL